VLAVGLPWVDDKGVKREAPCKSGDLIVHSGYTVQQYQHKGKKIRFINFRDVLGILE